MLQAAVMCLAMNVYFEARGENEVGQLAVANVTVNRAVTQDQVCDVVFAEKQFSWTKERVKSAYWNKRHVYVRFRKDKSPDDPKSWAKAVDVAQAILRGKNRRIGNGATLYHAIYVKPVWSKSDKYRVVAKIGKHIFYREV